MQQGEPHTFQMWMHLLGTSSISVHMYLASVLSTAQSPLSAMLLGLVGQCMFCEEGTQVPKLLAGNATAPGGAHQNSQGRSCLW